MLLSYLFTSTAFFPAIPKSGTILPWPSKYNLHSLPYRFVNIFFPLIPVIRKAHILRLGDTCLHWLIFPELLYDSQNPSCSAICFLPLSTTADPPFCHTPHFLITILNTLLSMVCAGFRPYGEDLVTGKALSLPQPFLS